MKAGHVVLVILVASAAAYLGWRWATRTVGGLTPAEQLDLLRWQGASLYDDGYGDYPKAREVLARVVEHPDATAQDLVNLACTEMGVSTRGGSEARARELLARAEALDPELAAVHYCQGILAQREQQYDVAATEFRRVLELEPEDVPAHFYHADALEQSGDVEAALRAYEFILDQGFETAGGYYFSTAFKVGWRCMRSKDPALQERGRRLTGEHQALLASGYEAPKVEVQERGNLGKVRVANPAARDGIAASPASAQPVEEPGGRAAAAGAVRSVATADVNADGWRDLVVVGERGVALALAGETGPGQLLVPEGAWTKAVVGDLRRQMQENPPCPGTAPREPEDESPLVLRTVPGEKSCEAHVLLLSPEGAVLLAPDATCRYRENPLPLDLRARDAVFVDHDHEGDLDLLAATDHGLVLLRNDGARPLPEGEPPPDEGTTPLVLFTDVTGATDLPGTPLSWVEVEDLDADNDVDFLAGTEDGPPILLSSLRKGRFETIPAEHCGLGGITGRVLLVDFDHDGRVDVAAKQGIHLNQGSFRFVRDRELPALSGPAVLADLNRDGEWDLCRSTEDGGLAVTLGSLLQEPRATPLVLPATRSGKLLTLLADLDRDGGPEALVAAPAGVQILRPELAAPGTVLQVFLQGRKDSPRGTGAVVEVLAGNLFQRKLARDGLLEFGLGDAASADVVRVTWPNGITQWWPSGDVPNGSVVTGPTALSIVQAERDPGSCPLLYTFHGSRYEFLTDVLGVTPLGLPMAEGVYVPPDHDELVRIEDTQLAAVDGEFRVALTEELREVTYLDRAQLWVVEHDAGVEVHPEERFTFPPFPRQRLHALRDVRPLVAARGSDGKDWTEELHAVDGVHAVPFELAPYKGLATPHFLELTLPDAARAARQVRLLLTGWFFWTDASVNVAVGHDPGWEFLPPLLQVPDGQGGWRDTGPPVGFPAGKTKTMVLDVTDLLNREDRRLRVCAGIRLYWDAIRVALDDGDAPVDVTRLEPTLAELSYRGFSRPLPRAREDLPERFEFAELVDPPWDQHEGMLTRYGDVLPLLHEIDDCFVIFSAGDAIDLRFAARWLPDPAPGRSRTYLLFLDGWAKDADPNTEFGGTVEPLPFHGMRGYPYGADQRYPDDVAHRRYLAEWNTRPGRRLVPQPSDPGFREAWRARLARHEEQADAE